MKIKQFIAVTLVGLSVAQAAHAQTWQREDYGGSYEPLTTGVASRGVKVEFGCGRAPTEAFVRVYVPWQSRFGRLAEEGFFDVAFVVDGEPIPLSLQFTRTETEAVFATSVEMDEQGFAESDHLNNLVYALQSGRSASISAPALGVESALPLNGSMSALRGIYVGCGMHLSGTGVMD